MPETSVEELLKIARNVYPPGVDGPEYRETPEIQRYQKAWEKALAGLSDWRKRFVARVRASLPEAAVADTTAPGATASRRCCVYLPRQSQTDGSELSRIIVACASVLVPYYYIYGAHRLSKERQHFPEVVFERPTEGEEGRAADVMARLLEEMFQIKEFPVEYRSVPVPDIFVGNLGFGQVTLLDAFFDSSRDSIP